MAECSTYGVIVKAVKCWWLKINTKPVRTHALDGAVFPYLLTVRYSAGGTEYERRKLAFWEFEIPKIGETVIVQYNSETPAKMSIRRL